MFDPGGKQDCGHSFTHKKSNGRFEPLRGISLLHDGHDEVNKMNKFKNTTKMTQNLQTQSR